MVIGALLIGLVLRYLVRGHSNSDADLYLIPWYEFARDHGVAGLGEAFTNYTPFYSYLLLIAAQFDRLGEPLSLVKAISAVFEFGCAVVAAQIVWRTIRDQLRAALAFAAVWLAPTVLFNGALWAQADSIWAFFILISVWLFMRGRNGMLPFATAVAVKAQGVFLGPFVFGLILRRKVHWLWLAAIPAVYLALALPVLVAGRPIVDVLGVYVDQAGTFRRLTTAANIWVFAAGLPYAVGVGVGIVLAACGGLALSILVARSKRVDAEFLLLAACASLVLMPFLLPKMHERYFYAFELAAIALACINPRYLAVAVIAQLDGVLAYLLFERGIIMGLPPAAFCNGVLAYFLALDLWRGQRGYRFPMVLWLGFGAAATGLLAYLLVFDPGRSTPPAYLVVATLATGMALLLVKESRAPSPLSGPGSPVR